MKCFPCLLLAVSGLCLASAAHAQRVTAPTVDVSTQPVIYVVGDSTAANQSRVTTIQGWGTPFLTYFAPTKVTAVNAALGGRSSRTFITEGHWDDLLAKLQPGDIVAFHGVHVAAYLGGGRWVDADTRRGNVAEFRMSDKPAADAWFAGRVRVLRWTN